MTLTEASPVILSGIRVPFGDLVVLYIKTLFAAIPAAIIAVVLIKVVQAVLSA